MDVKYRSIVSRLTEEILGGKFMSSGALPSERALALRFSVSRQTVQRVLRELCGRGLVYRRQGSGTFLTSSAANLHETVGLIVTGARRSEIVSEIRDEVTRLARRMGLSLVFGNASALDCENAAKQAVSLARDFAARNVSGVILQPVQFHRNAERVNARIAGIFAAKGIPVVLIDGDCVNPPGRSGHDVVGIDNFHAGRLVAAHLRDVGVKRLAFLAQEDYPPTIRLRMDGVESLFPAPGTCDAVVLKDLRVRSIVRACSRLRRAEAVVCQNDVAAINLMEAFRKMNVCVPQDVLVVGFDDVAYAPQFQPALTSVRQPCRPIAKRAFQLLLDRIGKVKSPAEDVRLMPALVIRESSVRKAR